MVNQMEMASNPLAASIHPDGIPDSVKQRIKELHNSRVNSSSLVSAEVKNINEHRDETGSNKCLRVCELELGKGAEAR